MIAQQFSVDGEVGLSQLLAASVSLEDVAEPTTVPLLTLLPAGHPAEPSELLGSRRMQELIEEPLAAALRDRSMRRRCSRSPMRSCSQPLRRRDPRGRPRPDPHRRDAEGGRGDPRRGTGTVYGAVLNRASTGRLEPPRGDVDGYSAYGKYGYGEPRATTVRRGAGPEEVDVEQAGVLCRSRPGRRVRLAH